MNKETPPHILKSAERLRDLFYGTKGYWTTLTDPQFIEKATENI
jgi:hypothetical protein